MCVSPLIRYRLKYTDPSAVGSVSFKIVSQKEFEKQFKSYSCMIQYLEAYCDYTFIPCRQCVECRMQYALDWGIRCAHEAQIRKNNSFITLSIDSSKASLFNNEKNLKTYCKRCVKGNRYIRYPIDYTLCKGMLLDELKRMRDNLYKKYGIKIRYFGCGEYGSDEYTARPHYHIIIFGYSFPDKVYAGLTKKGIPYFVSSELSSLWRYGIATVQDLNFRACLYTAKYCLKKIKSNNDLVNDEYYFGRQPEFLVYSKGNCQSNRCKRIDDIIKNCKGLNSLRNFNNPYCKTCDKTRGGIGFDWFLKYYKDVCKIGYITIDGIKYGFPKYYLDLLKLTDLEMYDKYKLNILKHIEEYNIKHFDERSTERLNVKKKILKSRINHTLRL